jgi:hypothetical protein
VGAANESSAHVVVITSHGLDLMRANVQPAQRPQPNPVGSDG